MAFSIQLQVYKMYTHTHTHTHTPYFLDYKRHRTIRRTYVLEEENRGKKTLHRPPPPESGKLHSDYKMHPHFLPKFGGEKVHLIV